MNKAEYDQFRDRLLDGSQNPTPPLAEFVAAMDYDDNLWWVVGCGHHVNLFEAAVVEIEDLRAEVLRASGASR